MGISKLSSNVQDVHCFECEDPKFYAGLRVNVMSAFTPYYGHSFRRSHPFTAKIHMSSSIHTGESSEESRSTNQEEHG